MNRLPLSEFELKRVLAPFGEAQFLPPRVYSEESVFQFEKKTIFKKTWIPVARESQLKNAGDYIVRELFGEPVIVIRRDDGKLNAYSNVCRHRARRIVDTDGSIRASGVLTCPYHAWSYAADGSLCGAPRMSGTPGFDVAAWRLPKFSVDTWLGFVFVNFDAAAKSLAPELASLTKVLEPLGIESMQLSSFADYHAPWNWKATMDNFTEGYHQPTIHRKSVEPTIPSVKAVYDDADGPYSLFWMPAADGVEFQTDLPEIADLPDKFRGGIVVVNVYPLLHLLIDQSCVMWLDWDIRGVNDHQVIWKLLAPSSTFSLPDFASRKERLHEFLVRVWGEDFFACQGVAAGAKSEYAQQGRMCSQERSVYQFHQWLARHYATAVDK